MSESTDYPRLSTIAPAGQDESLQAYGVRVLAFVLTTGITATISTADLELADHVYPIAVSGKEILPVAVDRLSAARHDILAAIASRVASTAPTGSPAPTIAPVVTAGGRLVPLQPGPFKRPPSGVAG